jgi:hypothetical protein
MVEPSEEVSPTYFDSPLYDGSFVCIKTFGCRFHSLRKRRDGRESLGGGKRR